MPDGAALQIPRGRERIYYRFSGGTIWRKAGTANSWRPVLSRVKTSEMEAENRSQIKVWHWDVKLAPRHPKARMPILLTFEAVPSAKP